MQKVNAFHQFEIEFFLHSRKAPVLRVQSSHTIISISLERQLSVWDVDLEKKVALHSIVIV